MKRLVALLIAGALLAPAFGLAYTSPGAPTGYVNDFADVLTREEERALESTLSAFEQETSHEIAVAVIPLLEGDDIESYANTLFREWGIGKADANNGVLLLVAIEDRKMRIEAGYGLEGALTDTEAKRIIDKTIAPQFKASRYAAGIEDGVERIMSEVSGEAVPSAAPVESDGWQLMDDGEGLVKAVTLFFGFSFLLLVFLLWSFVLLRIVATGVLVALGKSPSWWMGGVLGAGLWLLIWGVERIPLWLLVVFVGVGLGLDFAASRLYPKYVSAKKKRRWLWWVFVPYAVQSRGKRSGKSNWRSGGGSSGGGGFGGFGGGSSGGGGASGGW